jgi:hypothetical protein
VADARIVQVDSTPPVTTISTTFNFSTTNSTSVDSITFNFEVEANKFTCFHQFMPAAKLHTQASFMF